MEQVYDLSEVARATKLSIRTIRVYLKDLKIYATQYSAGKLQVSKKDLRRIREYAKKRAKKTRAIRRKTIKRVRYQHETPPMADDSQSPATKQDIKILMDEIGKLYDANMKWKDEILEKNEQWKDEIMQHFDVVAENIHHDTTGANKDEIEVLKDARQSHARLEQHTGFIAA